jgi:hypothetical protein
MENSSCYVCGIFVMTKKTKLSGKTIIRVYGTFQSLFMPARSFSSNVYSRIVTCSINSFTNGQKISVL